MPWQPSDDPKWHHVQTRLNDEDYAALRAFAAENDVNQCEAARSLIVVALHLVGRGASDAVSALQSRV